MMNLGIICQRPVPVSGPPWLGEKGAIPSCSLQLPLANPDTSSSVWRVIHLPEPTRESRDVRARMDPCSVPAAVSPPFSPLMQKLPEQSVLGSIRWSEPVSELTHGIDETYSGTFELDREKKKRKKNPKKGGGMHPKD